MFMANIRVTMKRIKLGSTASNPVYKKRENSTEDQGKVAKKNQVNKHKI